MLAREVPERDVDGADADVIGVSEVAPEILPDRLALEGISTDEVVRRGSTDPIEHRAGVTARMVPLESVGSAYREDERPPRHRPAGFVHHLAIGSGSNVGRFVLEFVEFDFADSHG